MINISNSTSKNNPSWLLAEPVRPSWPAPMPAQDQVTAPAAREGSGSPRARLGRLGRLVTVFGQVLVSWLAAIPRRLGDRLFVMNDTEAYWRGWQITKTRGGLARCYRDPRFDTLAECPRCRGAGVTADLACVPCLGTGRITLGEVS